MYHVSEKEFADYVKVCKDAGFIVDVTKTGSVFYAYDDEGYKLSIFYYESKDTMNVYVSAYELVSNTEDNGITTTTESAKNTTATEATTNTTENKTDETTNTESTNNDLTTEATTNTTENSVDATITPVSTIIWGDDSVAVTIQNNDYLVAKEFAWFMTGEHLNCLVVIHNPSSDMAFYFPTFRITAYDANNKVLGSDEQVLNIIYPQQDFACCEQLFELGTVPSRITVTLVEPDEYDFTEASLLEHPKSIPMVGENIAIETGEWSTSVTGELYNANDYKMDTAMLTVVFRDEEGKIVCAEQGFVDHVPANGSVPFDIDVNVKGQKPVTCEVYGYPWFY